MPIDASIPLQGRPVQAPDPLQAYAQVLSLKHLLQQQELFPLQMQAQQQALQMGQLGMQERQLELEDQQKMRQAYMESGGKLDDFFRRAAQLGVGPKGLMAIQQHVVQTQKDLAEIDDKKLAVEKYRNDQLAGLTSQALNLPDDQYAAQWPNIKAAAQRIKPDLQLPDQPVPKADLQMHQLGFVSQDELIKGEQERRAAAAEQRAASAERRAQETFDITKPGLQAKTDIEVASANALKSMTDTDWQKAIDNVIEDKNTALYRRTVSEVQFYRSKGDLKGASDAIKRAGDQLGKTETAVATAKATVPYKIEVAGQMAAAKADAAGLTEDDYKRAGEIYQRTGVMPAMGRDSYTRSKIVHYGNAWARDNGFSPADIVTMQASYAGDKESLKKFQAQRDQIVSFEQTAQKNLDLMLDAGKKLVDSGSKYLNRPLRSINRSLLSTDEQAAFDAAELIARNEVAKVTSGGGLGGVVSDTAKKEMAEAMGKDPTIDNMIAVAKIFKQDMANRHQSMDATLGDIKARIGGGGPTGGGLQRIGVTDPRGVTHYFDTQAAADAFKAAAGIR